MLFVGAPAAVDGLAAKGVYYFDDECGQGQETGTYYLAFGSYNPDPESNTSSREPFNECYIDTSTTILDGRSSVYTCNLSTGETKFTVYEDQECSDFYLSTGGTGSCSVADIFDDDDGDVCLEEEACSSNETCTDDEPFAISPNAFNVVAAQYSDDKCAVPTGVDHVVSGYNVSAPGFSTEGCFAPELDPEVPTASLPFLSECLSDGSAVIQLFGLSDLTCSGEVQLEYHTNFTPHMSSGPDMRRMADAADSCYPVGDYSYRPVSCTLDAVTVEGSTTTSSPVEPTPSPTAGGAARDIPGGVDSSPAPTAYAPTASGENVRSPPSPVASPTPPPSSGTSPSPTPGETSPPAASLTPPPSSQTTPSPSPTSGEAPMMPDTAVTEAPTIGAVESATSGATAVRTAGIRTKVATLSCWSALLVALMYCTAD
ncbi:unnamed protein product [Ectocarpus sp. 12 AP-2014]